MTNVSELNQESDNELIIQTVAWDVCPVEILIIIFEKLDITSLRCCSLVNRRWKEIVYNVCESRGLWQDLAIDSIVNHGMKHRNKSTLSWKDLYFNSLLWNSIKSASIVNTQEINKKHIKNINVYKDNIIVVNSANVEYYAIENFECVRVIRLMCDDFQESDDMMVVVHHHSTDDNDNYYYTLTLFLKLHNANNFKHLENHFIYEPSDNACEMSRSWRWIVHDNCCYIIDWKCVLWKANRTNDNCWIVKSLAKYYGPWQSYFQTAMNTIHVLKEDVFVSLKWGDLIEVQRDCLAFSKKIRDVPTCVITGPNIDKLPHKECHFNALINVPFGTESLGNIGSRNILHFHYSDPEMTCGLQHGEVVILGFEDGRVQIRLLKEHFTSEDSNKKPKVEFNIKDYDRDPVEDPAITGLDVCEVKDMHKLFIKTSCKLYQFLIQYLDSCLER